MKIDVAPHTGFCMGVRKAVLRIVEEINTSEEEIYVYGPLIHNPQTIRILDKRGVKTIHSLDAIKNKTIAIRTHGIPVNSLRKIKEESGRYINLTCPRVARVQGIVKKYSSDGFYTIIIGDPDHAEVKSIKSYAASGVAIVSSISDIDNIENSDKYIVVAQTTLNKHLYSEITSLIQDKLQNVIFCNTICDSTHNRQDDVIHAIEKGIDALVVVGGKNSANTNRLASIGRSNGISTFHIETEEELNFEDFSNISHVLVTAGASTPGWIINNVLEKLFYINYHNKNIIYNLLKSFFEFVIRTNIISAIASAFMTLFFEWALGIWSGFKLPAVSAMYVFSMYSVNNYFAKNSLKESNPFKYKLHINNSFLIILLTIISLIVSQYFILSFDSKIVVLFYILLVTGILYTTPVVQKIIKLFSPRVQILYKSKSMIATLGWILICSLPVLLIHYSEIIDKMIFIIPVLLFATYLIVSRNLLHDIIGYHGDLIIGSTTLPITIGINRTMVFHLVFALLTAFSMLTYAIIINNMYIALFLFNIIYYLIIFNKISKLKYFVTLEYEVMVDINFILFILLGWIVLL